MAHKILALAGCLLLVVAESAVATLQEHATSQEQLTDTKQQHFRFQVLPVLQRRCFSCHSHAAQQMEGSLSLDWRSGWENGGGRGPAVVPGDVENSLLLKAIRHDDADLKMPEDKLPPEEIAVITEWISAGAFDDRTVSPEILSTENARDWWSLKPLEAPPVPILHKASGGGNPIDAFLRAKQSEQGLRPVPEADRRTLIRRLSFDLTGLPPTFEQVQSFIRSSDPQAWETLVDELLASPRYGERWARHWMDTIHFADSHGYEHDVGRDNAWRYRDYLIQSLNRDISWDRFVREQLAADFFYPNETQLTPALGFLGAGTFDLSTFSTAPVTFDYLDRDDLVNQTMAAFVSTTANCARCHAHKFDPISQEDYYSLQAVFSGVLKGDVAYDEDPRTQQRRRELQHLLTAVEQLDETILLNTENVQKANQWLQVHESEAAWQALSLDTFVSMEGATLTTQPQGFILAGGLSPDVDTYVVTGRSSLKKVTGLRLDLFPHDSLPVQGPGRCQNGNLHLSEVDVQVFDPGQSSGRKVAILKATADFNQTNWTIDLALDGNPKTAWGIHPEVSKAHHAVFEFAEPQDLSQESRIVITLRQLHGGSHLIGAFRLSVTDAPSAAAIAIPDAIRTAIRIAPHQRTREQQLALSAFALREIAQVDLKSLPAQVVTFAAAPAVKVPAGNGVFQSHAMTAPKTVHVLQRGDFQKPGTEVQPGALSVLRHAPDRFSDSMQLNESARRAALADWIAHRDNVLTWRSIVNRVWHYHFARGLCDTPNDFGRMGGVPSHPELLDWLSVWFRDEAHGSLKQLHRLIVTSETYRQSSLISDPETALPAFEKDAENKLLWRQNRQRLDADSFRDFALSACGTLDFTVGGPAVQNFHQSRGPQSTPALDYSAYDWSSPGAGRRSIYRYVWRGIPDPLMEALDFPDLGLLSPTRSFSASSLQSLALYNNNFVLYQSQHLEALEKQGRATVREQVISVVRRIWLRDPTTDELAVFAALAERDGLASLCRVLLNSNEFLFVD